MKFEFHVEGVEGGSEVRRSSPVPEPLAFFQADSSTARDRFTPFAQGIAGCNRLASSTTSTFSTAISLSSSIRLPFAAAPWGRA
mgnify:CR=1 FL=1